MKFVKFAALHKEIIEAISFLLTDNFSVSTEAIDFMKKASLDKLKHMESVYNIKAKR